MGMTHRISIPHLLASIALAAGMIAPATESRASTSGVNAHIPTDPIMDSTVDAGIGWVRIDFVWAFVEIERDRFEWAIYDTLIEGLQARGLRIYASVVGTPSWATSGSEFSGVPDNPDEWKAFCYLAAKRYRGRIDAWGFWNEPNLDHFWEGSRWAYLNEILIPGIDAVRTADPDALVAGPDLAHLNSGDWDDWLDDVVSQAGDMLDVVTHHAYPSDGSAGNVTEKLTEGGDYPWDPPSVRSVLEDAGWGHRPVWLTETGVESGRYGEVGQENFYDDLLADWFGEDRGHTWLDRIFFYEMTDPSNNPDLSWGILNPPPGLEPKLAYHAYAAFIQNTPVDGAEITIHGLPAFIGSRETVALRFEILNTGTTTWTEADGYTLIFDVDLPGWGHEVEPFAGTEPVHPGDSIVFDGTLRSAFIPPSYPSQTVHLYVRMARTEGPRFGDAPFPSVVHTARVPPVLVLQPTASEVPFNGQVSFSVIVESETDTSYQWRRDTVVLADDHRITGSREATLTVSAAGFGDLGDYDCVVTNAAGSVRSVPVALVLAGSPIRRTSGRLIPGDAATVDRWRRFTAHRLRFDDPQPRPVVGRPSEETPQIR